MDYVFYIGLTGAITLVAGAAWPDKKFKHPTASVKNWLLAFGALIMLTYSTLNYLNGGSIFFIFLQGLVNFSSIMMMLNVPDRIDTPLIVVAGLALMIWSLYLFEGYNTIFFIIGLAGIALGYALDGGTVRRNFALTLGSALIATFSYIESDWIFFWLNVFFAIFSLYYTVSLYKKRVS